jgi:hypothetical protein
MPNASDCTHLISQWALAAREASYVHRAPCDAGMTGKITVRESIQKHSTLQYAKRKIMQRRTVLQALLAAAVGAHLSADAAPPEIAVYKSASCGCCTDWITHLQENGFTVKARDVANPSDYREKFGIPAALGSCHTGMVAGYAIEGHVPAREIKRLLAERPKARGLAVPAMPMGSPGMEGARSDPFDVLLVQMDGRHTTYRHYGAK